MPNLSLKVRDPWAASAKPHRSASLVMETSDSEACRSKFRKCGPFRNAQMQLYSAMIDFGLDIQEAIEMPRFLSGRFALGEARDTLHMESRFPESTIDALARRGHPVNRWGAWNEMAGHAHGITIDRRNGMLSGGSDPRSDGAAIGY